MKKKQDKALHVIFTSFEDLEKELLDVVSGKDVFNRESPDIRFENYNQFMSFMFPNKFNLLVAIYLEKPASLYKLAKIVGRQQNAVLRDCDELEHMGFIRYEEGARNAKKPLLYFDYDSIVVHDNRGTQKHLFPNAA